MGWRVYFTCKHFIEGHYYTIGQLAFYINRFYLVFVLLQVIELRIKTVNHIRIKFFCVIMINLYGNNLFF